MATTAQLEYLAQATPKHPMSYPNRYELAKQAGVVLDVFVPRRPEHTRILPGSAIVGLTVKDMPDQTLVYFEGDKYNWGNRTYDDCIIHAVNRMVVRYPTIAMAVLPNEDLVKVGTYDVATSQLRIENQEALDEWTAK